MVKLKYDPMARSLEKAARTVLGSYYEDFALCLLNLYLHCDKQDKLYHEKQIVPSIVVANITRRSNVLSAIFGAIMRYYAAMPKEKQPYFFQTCDLTAERIAYLEHCYFITDTSLVTQSQEIANHYLCYNEMPEIIIFDELLLHGRALNNLLSQLEDRMFSLVQDHGSQDHHWDVVQFQQQLLNHIEILVYMQNDDELLLVSRYQQRLSSWRVAPLVQVRELSKRFSMLIEKANQNNVAYSWSLSIPYLSTQAQTLQTCQPGQNGFFPRLSVLQYNEVVDYICPYPNTSQPKAICAVRWRHSCLDMEEKNNVLMLVPYIIFEKYSLERLLALHYRIAKDLENLDVKFFTALDSYIAKDSARYARWLSETNELVLNSLMFHRFLKTQGVNNLELGQENLFFLARNYTTLSLRSDEIYQQLILLWKWGEEHCEEELFETYMDLLLADTDPIWIEGEAHLETRPIDIDLEDPTEQILVSAVENAIIYIANETERHAYDKYHSIIPLEDMALSNWGKYYSIRTILDKTVDYLGGTASVAQRISILALIIHEMDLGIIGMNSLYESEHQQVYTVIRAGEQALSVEPIRYQTYIPVLLEILERCRQYQMDLYEEISHFFSKIPEVSTETVQQLYEFVVRTVQFGGGLDSWLPAISIPMHTKLFRRGVERNISDANRVNIEKQMLYLEAYARL